jgi:hypothetical protein
MASWEKHGEYRFYRFEKCLVVKIYGSWNLECAKDFRKELEKALDAFSNDSMIHILDTRNWEMGTPEAMTFLKTPLYPMGAPDNRLRIEILNDRSEFQNLLLADLNAHKDKKKKYSVLDIEETEAIVHSHFPDLDFKPIKKVLLSKT